MLQMSLSESPSYYDSTYVTLDDLESRVDDLAPIRPGDTVTCPYCQTKEPATSEEQATRVLKEGCSACEPVSPMLQALKKKSYTQGVIDACVKMFDAWVNCLDELQTDLEPKAIRALVAEMLLQ